MSSKRWGWTRHFAVLSGFEMVFAGVAAVGIFLTAAGMGFIGEAVAVALTAIVLLAIGTVLLRASSHRDARRTKIRRLQYRARYRG